MSTVTAPSDVPSRDSSSTTQSPIIDPLPSGTGKIVAPKGDDDTDSGDESGDDPVPTLNTKEDLRKGIIKTTNNRDEFTILLVGETGVGKTSTLNYIANILAGNAPKDYADFNEKLNEQGGSQSQSQTNDAIVYTFKSRNGVTMRIMDTPGLADTRGMQQDEQHKASIAKAIRENIDTVNAVIILANGTVPRLGVVTKYALTTLSAIFPRSLANNIAIMFTMVPSIIQVNFSMASLPPILTNSLKVALSNPICLKQKLDEAKKMKVSKLDLNMFRQNFKDSEERSLDMMVQLLDWLTNLNPQPTKDIVSLYDKSTSIETQIQNAITRMGLAKSQTEEIEALKDKISKAQVDMNTFKDFKQIITQEVHQLVDSSFHSTLCTFPQCYKICHENCQLDFAVENSKLKNCSAMQPSGDSCNVCNHSRDHHRHNNKIWALVKDSHLAVDPIAEQNFLSAESAKKQAEIMMATVKTKLDQIAESMKEDLELLGTLVTEYSELSLSGGFTVQIEMSVEMINTTLTDMRQDPRADRELIKKLEVSLKALEVKRDVLREAHKAKQRPSMLSSLKNVFSGNS